MNVIIDTLTETLGFQPEIYFVVMDHAAHVPAASETDNAPRKRTTMVTPSQTHRDADVSTSGVPALLAKVRISAQSNRLTPTMTSREVPAAQPWAERIVPGRDFTSRVQGQDFCHSD